MAGKTKISRPKAARGKKGGNPGARLAWLLVRTVGCGLGLCVALMALFAFVLARTPVPLSLVRPLACVAGAAGAAASGVVLAGGLGKSRLVCGLGCGVFYALCLLAATLALNGQLDWQGANAMLPLALLLGGAFGGALSALREGH